MQPDRRRHVYLIGMTGTGKTGLLLNMMHGDLMAGAGFCFLDPHGDACQHIASLAPKERGKDVIYLDPSDPTHTFAYNPLSGVPEAERATAAANIVSAFKSIWAQSWGPRLEYILGHSLRLLLDAKDQTLLGLPACSSTTPIAIGSSSAATIPSCDRSGRPNTPPMMRDCETRRSRRSKTRSVRSSPIPFIRSILCQNSSTLKIADLMNKGKVLIVNLSKGNLGTEPAHLLGALLITACSQAAEARRHIPEHDRRDFTLYVDEFQNFATESFATILSEARKWRLSLVAANQTISQLPDALQHAVFGNAGTLIVFRVGSLDAKRLAGELGLANAATLTQTNNYRAWVRLMRYGAPLEPRLMRHFLPRSPACDLRRSSPSRDQHT